MILTPVTVCAIDSPVTLLEIEQHFRRHVRNCAKIRDQIAQVERILSDPGRKIAQCNRVAVLRTLRELKSQYYELLELGSRLAFALLCEQEAYEIQI